MKELLADNNELFDDIKDRMALMLTNKTKEDFGITDELIETPIDELPQVTSLMKRIADFFGELLEDLEFDYDTVDQIKLMFMLIDVKKIVQKEL